MQEIPPSKPTDPEDVAWGLQTAASLWKRGERSDAVAWLRRAAQAASDAQDDDRALELARIAAELADYVGAQGTVMPGAPSPSAPPPPPMPEENTSLDAVPKAAQEEAVVSNRAPSVPPAEKVHAGMFDPWSEPPPAGAPVPQPVPAFPPPPIVQVPPAPITKPLFGEEEVVTSATQQSIPAQALPSRPAPPASAAPPPAAIPPAPAAPAPGAPGPAAPTPAAMPGKPPPLPPAGSRKPPPLPPRALKRPPVPGSPAAQVAQAPAAPRPAGSPKPAPVAPSAPVVPQAPITQPLLSANAPEPAASPAPAPAPTPAPPPPFDVPPPPAHVYAASAAPPEPAPRFPTPAPARPAPPVTPIPPSAPTAQTDVPSLYPSAPPRDDSAHDVASTKGGTAPPPAMPPRFDQLDEPDDMAATPFVPPVALRAPAAEIEAPSDLEPTPALPRVETAPLPPPPEEEPAPAPAPEAPVANDKPKLDLEDVDAFSDLPDDARAEFAAASEVHELAEGDEVAGFALAYVMEGSLDVAATMVDAAAVRLAQGAVLRARGTTNEGVPMRIIALPPGAVVATWSGDAVEKAFANTPWVEEDLRAASDRVMTLVGITIGPLGERLDQSIREEIVGRLTVKPLIPGEIVVNKGEPVPGLLLVGVGEIELVDGDDVKGVVGSGDFLFASEVLGAGAAPYTARAGAGGALAMFGNRSIAQELMVTCPPLLEVFAGM